MGISFLRLCFTLDPLQRPTAEELLNHPWMQSLRAELTAVDPPPLPTEDPREPQEPLIARQAHAMEQRQIAEMILSPVDENLTPRA